VASLLLGVDVGTTGLRAALFDATGQKHGVASAAHPVDSPRAGWAETDPERWWTSLGRALHALGPALADVAAVGIVGQAPTAVLVGAGGRAVRPAILWLDTRSDSETHEIARRLGTTLDAGAGGNRIHAYFLGPKLSWIARHEPEVLARTAVVLQSHAFLVHRLTGAATIDPSTAALAAPLFDLGAKSWSADRCEALGVATRLLPPVHAAASVAGTVHRAASEATGLREGVPVVAGGGDFAASTLAAGVVDEGEACLMLGTAGNLLIPTRAVPADTRLINSHHVGCDRYLALGGTLCGGALEWFRGACAPGVAHDVLDAEAAAVAPGAEGLVFLPYLQGERTPLWNVDARGAFVGLELRHGRGAMWRAVLEGIALSFEHCADVVRASGVALARVTATNGAGKSALFRQVIADALGVPLAYAPASAGTVAGAAFLAGLGVGAIPGPEHARSWLGPTVDCAPRPDAQAVYKALFARRGALHDAIERARR
jgi:xylulokinase